MRRGNEEGSALIIVIGVIAALAIMAASIVVLTANVSHNTYTDRMRVKAFNVTEAGLDAGMYTMSRNWPTDQTSTNPFNSTWYSTFRGTLDTSQFPAPSSGSFMTVSYFDDPPYTSPYSAANPPSWDMNGNNRLYMVVQGGVGPKASRIQAQVERTFYDTHLPRGIALYSGASLYSNGGGNNPKITVEVPPPVGFTTSIHVVGTIDAPSVSAPGIAQLTGAAAGTVNDVFPKTLRDGLRALAVQNGRYFTSQTAAEASPVDPVWSPQGGMSGLTVIEDPTHAGVTLRGTYNSEMQPGILMILDPVSRSSPIDYGGGGDYYGVVYVEGPVMKGHGSFCVHGMAVSNTDYDMRGTTDVKYNDNCIARLMNRWSLNVQLVPNTWRELRPQ